MPLQETSGNVTTDAYGGGVAAVPNYIEDVFSTYLYTGNATDRTITNGIDLSTKGGLVWTKTRDATRNHCLADTVSGQNTLASNLTTIPSYGGTGTVLSYNTNGYNIGTSDVVNLSGYNLASWTFRKQPKFFDVVTYTGTGATRTVPHNLGSVPGCIIVKKLDTSGEWAVYHRSLLASEYLVLNSTVAKDFAGYWGNTRPTSTEFTVGALGDTNGSGNQFVAYIFAHNAGGFGLTGTENVISCGSFTDTTTVNLGYEPQWVLFKKSSSSSIGDWFIADNMRGFSETSINTLSANTSSAEASYSNTGCVLTSTGFTYNTGLAGSGAFIYIAIRRGPMKVPTDATKVFAPVTATQSGNTTISTGFPVDFVIANNRGGANHLAVDRLRGGSQLLQTASTAAEVGSAGGAFDYQTSILWKQYADGVSGAFWNFQRAPSFFDEVCYTGNSTANTQISHNLGVAPELMIVKNRTSAGYYWMVYSAALGATKFLWLNAIDAVQTTSSVWSNTNPTASVFTVGTSGGTNTSPDNYVAYLFATCAGVSKCTAFTGNGSTQTINCGFTSGARFVMIKATSTTGNWLVFDTARGMTTSTDPWLALNSTAAESATSGACTTTSVGFTVDESKLTGVNTNGVSYIVLAVA